MKKLLEEMEKNEELKSKVEKLDQDPGSAPKDYIELAAQYGVELKEEDFKPADVKGELSEEELDAVAGGTPCACIVGGGGEVSTDYEKTCACVLGGAGEYKGAARYTHGSVVRCACAIGGSGDEGHYKEYL